MARRNQTVINKEISFPETEELVSTTDLRGVITYVNDPFCRVAGYSREELLNKNHNLVRHPEMPKEAFKDLWEHLKQGQAWRGAVKNRCKDGQYYWVDAFVTPIYQHGQLVGYQSVRRKLAEPIKKRAEKLYASVINKKSSNNSRLKELFNYPSRLSLAVLCSIFIIACTYWVHPLLSILIPILFFLFMYRELMTAPRYEQRLKQLYDSISRQVYCEDPANIAEFHLAMNEGRIKTILGRAADSSVELSHKVKELETASQHSTHNVESESIELEKVSAAMEEMLATTKEIAQNSTQTSEQIHDASDQCTQSIHRMTSTQSLMNKLVHDVDSSSKSTLHLSEQINSIQALMTDITDIAGQTNLLALNAAIEAARAGEQGRGFAVVADEVRNLSQKSHKTAERIQESMSRVISAALELEATMKTGEVAVKETLDNMAETQLSITNLTSIMTDIESVAYQISTATEEQIAVTNEINQNIAMIHDTSQSNLNDANQVNSLSQDIEKKSQQLRSLSQSFD